MIEHDILVPVILSGGTGSRLWPVSRESHPKPFIKLPDGESLLQKTYLRANYLAHTAEIITLTNKEYYLKSKAEYDAATTAQSIPNSFLLEPLARNTAPAVAFAALKAVATHGHDAILLVLPADHLVADMELFSQYAAKAHALAKANKLVTFGITPRFAETGFGYIERGDALPEGGHHAIRFVEKPNAALAESYVQSKRYLWNAGMFCFKASTVLQQLEQHAPALLNAIKTCWDASVKTNTSAIELDAKTFADISDISIDYALMEKSSDIAVIECDFDWQDIGSWEAYKNMFSADKDGNTVMGETVLIDSHDNFIHSDHRMIAAIGINHLAVIDTPDAILITDRNRTQDVKHVVQALKNKSHASYLTHRTVIRPWGSYTVLEEGTSFKIKRIVVKPKASLSLQLHHHRSEHWVVVEGTAKVVNGDKEYLLQTNESTFVPVETKHRLSNPGDKDLIMIEVQTGSYLGEDDIVRFEDTYGRIN